MVAIGAIAVAITLLNAIKPLHMDDTVYYSFASHLAAQPSDPYGGDIAVYWAPSRPSMQVLAPVSLPYLWSLALRIHGDNPFLCKLWLLPYALLLVSSTWNLAHRFARGCETITALLVAFSPAILPGMNFMLDIPAYSLGLTALHVFTRACDRRSCWGALLAGAVAGIAINTKWTGLVVPGVLGIYALTHRRLGLGIIAGLVATGVFAGWEGLVYLKYGQSHFLLHSRARQIAWLDPIKAFIAIIGGVCPAAFLLGLAGLKLGRFVPLYACIVIAVLVAIGFGTPALPLFLVLGLCVLVNLAHVAIVLHRRPARPHRRRNADSLFLVLWLVLEVVGMFVLSPYSAVRRVVGMAVVATFLTARLASRTRRDAAARRLLNAIAIAGALLGIFYYVVDLHEARVERSAAETASHEALSMIQPGSTVWFVGRWGFRYYANRAGLKQVIAGDSELKRGDILVVHDNKMSQEPLIVLDPRQLVNVLTLNFDADALPFRTVPNYYQGKVPVNHQEGSRFTVRIYRVTNPFLAAGIIPRDRFPADKPVGATLMRRDMGSR